MPTNKREDFIRAFTTALASGDMHVLSNGVTDDIRWHPVGREVVKGKDAFLRTLAEMYETGTQAIEIAHVITHGTSAAANGTLAITDAAGQTTHYGFCDVFQLRGFKDGKVAELTSYIIELAP